MGQTLGSLHCGAGKHEEEEEEEERQTRHTQQQQQHTQIMANQTIPKETMGFQIYINFYGCEFESDGQNCVFKQG